MINIKLITRIFKIMCLFGLILMIMNSCDDSNPMTMEEPCCVYPPDLDLMSQEQTDIINNEWAVVRLKRNGLLQDTDRRASSDRTLTDDWRTYRQALRDVPTQSDPFNITWPTEPS